MFYEKLKGFPQDICFIYSKSAVFLNMPVVDMFLSASWMGWLLYLLSLQSEFQSLGMLRLFCHYHGNLANVLSHEKYVGRLLRFIIMLRILTDP